MSAAAVTTTRVFIFGYWGEVDLTPSSVILVVGDSVVRGVAKYQVVDV